jgi:hypothetical protein
MNDSPSFHLFTLGAWQSGLSFYTTQRDAAHTCNQIPLAPNETFGVYCQTIISFNAKSLWVF